MLVNCIALYGAFRKTRTEANRADAAVKAEKEELEETKIDDAIERWRAFALEQEQLRQRDAARHEGIIEQMRSELAASREEGGKCRERSARQEVMIENLQADLKEMRVQNRRATPKTGSGDHEPV